MPEEHNAVVEWFMNDAVPAIVAFGMDLAD